MTETETIESIRYTADVVCLRGDDVLLIRRGWPPHQGALALPGGHVDPGETSRKAAARELLEETGVRVLEDDLILIGVYDTPGRDPRGRYVSVAYAVTVPADTTARPGDDADAVQWTPLNNPGRLAFDHSEIVHAAQQRQRATADTDQAEPAQPPTPAHAPALKLPAIKVACPACGSAPGALCTSHSGTRLRRNDVHQARTAAATA